MQFYLNSSSWAIKSNLIPRQLGCLSSCDSFSSIAMGLLSVKGHLLVHTKFDPWFCTQICGKRICQRCHRQCQRSYVYHRKRSKQSWHLGFPLHFLNWIAFCVLTSRQGIDFTPWEMWHTSEIIQNRLSESYDQLYIIDIYTLCSVCYIYLHNIMQSP